MEIKNREGYKRRRISKDLTVNYQYSKYIIAGILIVQTNIHFYT